MISIVIPSMNEEDNISIIAKQVSKQIPNMPYEIIFIDDGSTDGTLKNIKQIAKLNNKIKFISFSRNFGHQNALKAGMDFAAGDCVITMDCDLQHPPELIREMIEKWQKGFEVVYTVRDDSQTPIFKKLTSKFFYRLINIFSDIHLDNGSADFRLLDRKVVDVIKQSSERELFLRGLIKWMGFKQFLISYVPKKRFSGKTKYSFKRMLLFAVNGITSFSVKPLQLSALLGFTLSCVSGLYAIYALTMHFTNIHTLSGWTSVIISVLFLGGIQLLMLGIIGEYLGKLFMESKKRPTYIVSESNL